MPDATQGQADSLNILGLAAEVTSTTTLTTGVKTADASAVGCTFLAQATVLKVSLLVGRGSSRLGS
jgi:hypothetical protein